MSEGIYAFCKRLGLRGFSYSFDWDLCVYVLSTKYGVECVVDPEDLLE